MGKGSSEDAALLVGEHLSRLGFLAVLGVLPCFVGQLMIKPSIGE